MGTRVLIKVVKGKWADQVLGPFHRRERISRRLQVCVEEKKKALAMEVFKTYTEITDDPNLEIEKDLSFFPELISISDPEYLSDHKNWGLRRKRL